LAPRLAEAEKIYDYPTVLEATRQSIGIYRLGFERDLEEFERQEGMRVELDFSYRGLSRSRSSLRRTWVMDDGDISLCLRYRVYVLKTEGLRLEIHGAGVLEHNDWDEKHKKVVFFLPALARIEADGEVLRTESERAFTKLEIMGDGAHILLERPGRIRVLEEAVRIETGR